MIWMTWRQSRAQAVTAIAALAAFALLLAVTGPHLAGLYRASGVSACHGARCGLLASGFLNRLVGVDPVVYTLGIAAIVGVPAVISAFWGAPLIARELETGTFRLAWTQSITRTRWLTAKLALTGAAAMAVAEGLSLMFGWWAAPIGQAARLAVSSTFPLGLGPFSLLAFDAHGIARRSATPRSPSPSVPPPESSSGAPSRPWPSRWRSSPPFRSSCRWGSARISSRPSG